MASSRAGGRTVLPSITMSLTSRLLPEASPGWRGGGAGGSSNSAAARGRNSGAGRAGWLSRVVRRSKPGAERLGGEQDAGGHQRRARPRASVAASGAWAHPGLSFLACPATGAAAVLRIRLPHQRPGAGVEEHRSRRCRARSAPALRPGRGQRPVGRGRQAAAAAAGEAGARAAAGGGAAVAQQAAGVEEHARRAAAGPSRDWSAGR